MGDYKKKMLEYLVKISKNPEIKNLGVEGLAALLTGQNIKNSVKRSSGNFLINVFIIMMIVLQAFFPKMATYTTIIIAIIFIIALVAIAFALLGTAGTSAMIIGDAIMNFLIPVFILLLVSIFIKLIGSPNYYDYIYKNVNPIAALFSLLIALGIGMAIAKSGGSKFILGSFIYALALFIIIPAFIAMFSENPWGLCVKLPFLPDYCNPRETIVNSVSYVSIPTTGGISVDIDTSNTLYAGEPYEFRFRITNRYKKPIEFHVVPTIISNYGDVEFKPEYTQLKTTLKPGEYYDDYVPIQPDKIKLADKGSCFYTTYQIAYANGYTFDNGTIDTSQVECAIDKPCPSAKQACAKVDAFECKCVNWTSVTCSGKRMYARLYITHTGFLKGKATLYVYNYSKTHYIPPAEEGVSYTQGPLTVKVYIYPNPYIIGIHDYRKYLTMYVTFKNSYGTIKITNFDVKALTTNVTTIDKEKHLRLDESIGWKVIECKNISGLVLYPDSEISYALCKLTPPFVESKLTVYNPETNESKIILNNATIENLYNYCNQIENEKATDVSISMPREGLPMPLAVLAGNIDNSTNNTNENATLQWSFNWSSIAKFMDDSGLCDILKSDNNNSTKQIIESALNHTELVFEINYVRNYTYESSGIQPYTVTEFCKQFIEE